MDLEKKQETGMLMFYILIQEVDVTTSASSSEPSLEIQPKPFDLNPNRNILPEKTGTRLTRYFQCKSSHGSISQML